MVMNAHFLTSAPCMHKNFYVLDFLLGIPIKLELRKRLVQQTVNFLALTCLTIAKMQKGKLNIVSSHLENRTLE